MGQPFSPGVGAIIEFMGTVIEVTGLGPMRSPSGFGEVDFIAVVKSGYVSAGTIINTPFGQCEIVGEPFSEPEKIVYEIYD